jgi:hypothetical protein
MTKRRFAAILIAALAIFGAAAGTATAAIAGTTASAPSTWYHQ